MFYGINQWLADKGYIVLSVNYRRGVDTVGRSKRAELGVRQRRVSRCVAAGKYCTHADVDTVSPSGTVVWRCADGAGLARNSDLFAAGIDLAGHLGASLTPSRCRSSRRSSAPLTAKSPVLLHGDDDRNGLCRRRDCADAARSIDYELIVFPTTSTIRWCTVAGFISTIA
jgi:hypothetical protein